MFSLISNGCMLGSMAKASSSSPSAGLFLLCVKTSVFLLLVMQAECRKHAGKRKALKWWGEHLSKTHIPKQLEDLLCPMSSKDMNTFLDHLAHNDLPSFSDEFCKEAKLICDLDPESPFFTPPPPPPKRQHFKLSDMLVGHQTTLPPMNYTIPPRHFLPYAMAAPFDITAQNRTQVLRLLNISETSPLNRYMKITEAECEKQAQQHEEGDSLCASTLEDMVNFIAPKLGPHLDILQTKGPNAKRQNLTIVGIALKGHKSSSDAVVCSDSVYPFTLFKCYVARNVQNMEVRVQSQDNKEEFAVVMQCFSKKKAGHGLQALQGLLKKSVLHPFSLFSKMQKQHVKRNQVKPVAETDERDGDCQWMYDNELVFVRKEGDVKKKKKFHLKKFVILP